MEDFRRIYLRLCKEGGVEPQEGVVAQLQESRSAQGSRLDLSGQSLSADTCSVLAKAFHKDTVFTEVSLSDCMLSEEARVLLSGLLDNTTVKVLDLKGNNLRSSGAEVLGQLLAQNKTLRLVLEWNALGVWDEAFSLFCSGLVSNCALTQLDLRNNQINHHGASALALALKRNSTLEVLDLRWNNIGLLGGRSMLEALQNNKSIVQLEMAGNNIPSDTLKALHNSDRRSTLRESRSRTQVLSKEIQTLKEEKGRQFLSLMETIDRQRDEMGRSSSSQIGQLQEALNERKSAVNSLTALQMTEAALALSEQKNQNMGELLSRLKAEKEEQREQHSKARKKEHEFQELSKAKAAFVAERAQAEEELGRVRAQVRLEEQEHASSLEEKLRSVRSSLQEVQLHCSQQKQTISELQAKNSQQSIEMDGLRRRIEELQQELCCKDQEKVAEVSRVRVELQEQIGHLQAERTAQGALKEKISALERELKLSSNHREALLDKESEMSSMLEKLRLKEAEIHRIREDEANRASYLQSAVLSYIHGSPLGHHSSLQK
uniref:Leucine rich repeat containing 45 n=1 Tax=Pundamilia nyererei TaxID=303518 RepID=A0A3B4GNM3_9CICH